MRERRSGDFAYRTSGRFRGSLDAGVVGGSVLGCEVISGTLLLWVAVSNTQAEQAGQRTEVMCVAQWAPPF